MSNTDFLEKEIEDIKSNRSVIKIIIAVTFVTATLTFVKDILVENEARSRAVACIPTLNEQAFPIVYHQTVYNQSNHDAKIKTFVEEFVRLKYNESIVDYHAISTNRDVSLSRNLLSALEMSQFEEKAELMKMYSSSDETYGILKKANAGWVFLVDDMIIHNMPESGYLIARVRGEFQVTYDQVKVDLPADLWGYKEIVLIISQSLPTEDSKGEPINPYGYYVISSRSESLSLQKKRKLTERNHDFYIEEPDK